MFKFGKWPPRQPAWSYWLTIAGAAAWVAIILGGRIMTGQKTAYTQNAPVMAGVGLCSVAIGIAQMFSNPRAEEGYSSQALVTLKVVGGFFLFIGLMLLVFGLLRL